MNEAPTIKEMVSELVATPSMSSTLPEYDLSNQGVINKLAGWLDNLGFAVTINEIPGRPGKSNLLATLGEGRDGLLLSGHTDTVPLDEDRWHSDPFSIKEESDRWYGLGTCDMKSFFSLVINAVIPIARAQKHGRKPLTHPLTILASADEESSMSGVRALNAADIGQSRYAIIGEPTSLRPINRHKGIMLLRADITGQSGHSSSPDKGANALDASVQVIQELIRFRDYLKQTYQDARFEVNYPTLNLGCIHGGNNPNRICDQVTISLDIRTLPGMQNRNIYQELATKITNLRQDTGVSCSLALLHDPIAPFSNEESLLLDTLETLAGSSAGSVAFATEAPFLSGLGLETIIMGPGSIDQAHQPDEYIDLNQIEPTVAIIRALVEKYCL